MAFSKPTTTLLSRLLHFTQPRFAYALSFRATTTTPAAAPKGSIDGDGGISTDSMAQKAEDGQHFDTMMEKTYKIFKNLFKISKTKYPDMKLPEFPWDRQNYGTTRTCGFEMYNELKRVTAHIPDCCLQLSVILYRQFQVKGNTRLPFDFKLDEDKLYVRIDVPGIGSNDVKVRFENNTLYFSAEEKGKGDDGAARGYASKFDIPANEYRTDKISATVKNGVLEIVIPKRTYCS